MSSHNFHIWGTHLRWASLCQEAWKIIFSGMSPLATQAPPIVGEYKERIHDEIVKIVAEWFDRSQRTLYMKREEIIEYSVQPSWKDEYITLVMRPDIYVLWSTSYGPVNLAIEVTTRPATHISKEWLTAYILGLYIRNLRPSFALLATPEQVSILCLTTRDVRKLRLLIYNGSRRKPTPSLCYNCDLRQVCPNPLI